MEHEAEVENAARHALGALGPILDELSEVLAVDQVCGTLRALVDCLPFPAWIKTQGGAVEHTNAAYKVMYPVKPDAATAALWRSRDARACCGDCYSDDGDRLVCKFAFETLAGRRLVLGVSMPKQAADSTKHQTAALAS